MKKIITVVITIFALVFILTACSASPKDYAPAPGYSPSGSGSWESDSKDHSSVSPSVGSDGETSLSPDDSSTDIDPADTDTIENIKIPAGQLTAAEWSDKENYESWLKKCGYDEDQKKGIFFKVANNSVWNLPWADLYSINVVDSENNAVEGVKLLLSYSDDESSNAVYSAISDSKGNVSLFAKVSEERQVVLTAYYDGNSVTVPWTGEREQTIVLDGVNQKQNIIEIMFVIDTTGSMGDELKYLQAEIDDVIGKVKESLSDVTVRIALLFYRDEGDEYKTRYFDFNENVDVVKKNLNDQRASGGGDYPEAVHTALFEAVNKQWSSGNVTKLLIHVLDAPPHSNSEVAETYRNSLYSAAEQGIRIIPVASSGIDKDTEYLLRMEALLTGGTYTFLTDDSGIGYGHIEPTVDGEYVVELLNSMLVRLIKEYHTGEDIEPIDWRQEVKQAQ